MGWLAQTADDREESRLAADESAGPAPRSGTTRGLEAWLRTEHLPVEERIDRLAMDAEVVAELAVAGYHGPEWDFLAHVLAEYGIGVFTGWMKRGVVYDQLAQRRVRAPVLRQSVFDDPYHRELIAVTTVGDALRVFQTDVLPNGKWNPAKGAALSTYFIGQCMFRFGNAVQAWQRENSREHEFPATDDMLHSELDRSAVSRIADDVIRDRTARAILEGASNPRAARAMSMAALGYKPAQIAEDLDMTAKAVSSLLDREYRKAREMLTRQERKGTA